MTARFAIFLLALSVMNFVHGQGLDLSGSGWSFQASGDSTWHHCSVPGTNFSALFENHLISNPYQLGLEKSLSWVSEKEWRFKKIFQVDDRMVAMKSLELVCPGLDTYCSILLNGQLLGQTNNAFIPYRFPINSAIKSGLNELIFIFHSAKIITDSLYNLLPDKLPGGPRTTARKPQLHFGWDFAPEFISCGITHMPYLQNGQPIVIDHASVLTLQADEIKALLQLNLHVRSDLKVAREWKFRFSLGEYAEEFVALLEPGQNFYKKEIQFAKPKLWWPNGAGEPYLYPTRLEILDPQDTVVEFSTWHTGIRTIRLLKEVDSLGQSFTFEINGHKLFIKGSNYVPDDAVFTNSNRWKELLTTAKNSHFNMLRVWGGGRYEQDSFYASCDRLGLLVWQDFMFACAMYPGDDAFLSSVYKEANHQVKRLSKHACIALYCGNNENHEGWHRWGWQSDLSGKAKQRLWEDYQRVFDTLLPEAVNFYSFGTAYWPSSPLFGRGDERFKTHGDAHDWGLWHDELPFEALRQRIPRFMSEFGFQSYPAFCTLIKYNSNLDTSSDAIALQPYQKHPRGNHLIQEYLKRDYPAPNNLEQLIYLNQLCQADGISNLLIAHRMARPYCMGSLYWQFNDCWPGISWSGIDFSGHWKALQHAAQNAFRPVLFHGMETANGIDIWASNDYLTPQLFTMELTVQDFAGNTIYFQSFEDTLAANQSKKLHQISLNLDDLDIRTNHYLLIKTILEADTLYQPVYFDRPKNLQLTKSKLAFTQLSSMPEEDVYEIVSDELSKSVFFREQEGVHIFPNYFDIHPGIPQQIHVYKKSKNIHYTLPDALRLNDFIKY